MNICVVGLQWGDEGKGKVVDILAEQCDMVVRFGGGSNAGHTVVIGDSRFALHLLPSGSIRKNVACVIANAVVLDPEVLLGEIDGLAGRGISLEGRFFISENAHVVLDYHKREDQLREESLGKRKIGTTIRGIGPCYADKVGRSYAVRVGDFRDIDALKVKLESILEYKNKLFGRSTAPNLSMGRRSSRNARSTPSGCGRSSPIPRNSCTRRSSRASRSSSRELRGLCWISITGPSPM